MNKVTCFVCSSPAKLACGHCKQVAYCSQQHASQHWRDDHGREATVATVSALYKVERDDEYLLSWGAGVTLLKTYDGVGFYKFEISKLASHQIFELKRAIKFSTSGYDMCESLEDYASYTLESKNLLYIIAAVVKVIPNPGTAVRFWSSNGFLSFALIKQSDQRDDVLELALICSKQHLHYKTETKSFVRTFSDDDDDDENIDSVTISPKLGAQIIYLILEHVAEFHRLVLFAAEARLVIFYRKLGFGLLRLDPDDDSLPEYFDTQQLYEDDTAFDELYTTRVLEVGREPDEIQMKKMLRAFSLVRRATYDKSDSTIAMVSLPFARKSMLGYLRENEPDRIPRAFWQTYRFRADEK